MEKKTDQINQTNLLTHRPLGFGAGDPESLGNTPSVDTNIVPGITNSYIFFTLNPYDEWVKYIDERKKIDKKDALNMIVKIVLKKINKKYNITLASEHFFETSPTGRLHVHGMIQGVPATYYPFEGLLRQIAKLFHEYIGKKRNKHCIAADVQWAKNNDAVSRYCRKSQGNQLYYLIPKLT